MSIFLRFLIVGALGIATAEAAAAQNAPGLLNTLELQRLVATDTPEAHAALAKHFIALTQAYRRDSARYTALARAHAGNPNHPAADANVGSRMRKAEEATANATAARAVAAYHQVLSLGRTSRRPADAAAFDGGKGAPAPTPAELGNFVRTARTAPAHRELVEYFFALARTEQTNAVAYARMAQMARVSGARNTDLNAARYDHLASVAREAVRQANLAVELHRQLSAIG